MSDGATADPAPAETAEPAPAELTGRAAEIAAEPSPVKRTGKVFGPGLITGAAGDDPSGIGEHTTGPLLTALGWLVTAAMV